MYDPKSLKAEEFISPRGDSGHAGYAEQNKENRALIDSILDKARLRKG